MAAAPARVKRPVPRRLVKQNPGRAVLLCMGSGSVGYWAGARLAAIEGSRLGAAARRGAAWCRGSALRLILLTAAAVFLSEVLVAAFLAWSGESSLEAGAVFGGLFTAFLVTPVLYLLLVQPLRRADAEIATLHDQAGVNREAYRSLIDSTEDSIYLVDRAGRYRFINRHHAQRMGLDEVAVLGRTYAELHPPGKAKEFDAAIREVVRKGRSVCREHRSGRDEHCFLRTFSPVADRAGEVVAVTVVSKDVTELKRSEQRLRELSATDELTGLKNRRGFEDLAGNRLRLAERQGEDVALVYADLDELKQVNDRLGHPAGDRLIRAAAVVLRDACRESDVCARLGGDEFAILLTGGGPEAAARILGRIDEGVRRHNDGAEEAALSLSIGVSRRAGNERGSLRELISRADLAMYRAKAARKAGGPPQPPARSA